MVAEKAAVRGRHGGASEVAYTVAETAAERGSCQQGKREVEMWGVGVKEADGAISEKLSSLRYKSLVSYLVHTWFMERSNTRSRGSRTQAG